MKKTASDLPPVDQAAELAALADLPEAAIDTSDIPEIFDWSEAERGKFYRPIKQQLTIRLDADILAWFKARASKGEGYQTGINRALREYVREKGAKAG